jgi:hypothetical protein
MGNIEVHNFKSRPDDFLWKKEREMDISMDHVSIKYRSVLQKIITIREMIFNRPDSVTQKGLYYLFDSLTCQIVSILDKYLPSKSYSDFLSKMEKSEKELSTYNSFLNNINIHCLIAIKWLFITPYEEPTLPCEKGICYAISHKCQGIKFIYDGGMWSYFL